jgi:predicted metal-dependent peptidase
MNQEAATKITRARIAMIMRQPFFGTLAVRLVVKEDDTLNPPTLAVDGKTMYYHPQWVLDNDLDIVMSGVAHEVGHCVFDHIGRRNGREPTRWNYAGDYVINAVLKDCGFTIGPNWLYDPIYANMTTDTVYQALPPIPPGSANGGKGPFDKHFDSLPGGTDPAMHTDDWQIAGIQAANAARAQGDLPASLKRFIDELTSTKADWRAVMRRFFTERSRDDYSYARLNRKFASLGIFLPGLYSETMGLVIASIDTSGSISQPIFSAFIAELDELRNQLQPTGLHIIQCDAAIGKVDEFEQYDDFDLRKIEATGGGGTDFRPPFDYVEKQNIEPRAFVYLTDGYGPFPDKEPPYPVLWLMTTDVKPPWGEVVRIEV